MEEAGSGLPHMPQRFKVLTDEEAMGKLAVDYLARALGNDAQTSSILFWIEELLTSVG